jgi:hypothetical protein
MKLLVVILSTMVIATWGRSQTLVTNRYHLRSGATPEWEEFENKTPHGTRLDLKFQAQKNSSENTLLIHQYNVKLEWQVQINGQKLGTLFLMEDPLVSNYRIPAGLLKQGENTLSIIPPKENDDVVVGPFRVLNGAIDRALNAHLNVTVTESGHPAPCRITIVNEAGELAALYAATNQNIAARPGVLYSVGGARVQLLPGTYAVLASRGPEYNLPTTNITLTPNLTPTLTLPLLREVPTPNLVSCDTHIHSFTYAKHGDATIHERMLTLAGEALELPISTEHNMLADFIMPAKAARVAQYLTPVLGCEVTTKRGHFNAFPIVAESRVPDFRIEHWPALLENIRATPGVQFVILNHPRDVHTDFCPFAETNFNARTGENLRGFDFTFDGVELINSGALRTDLMQVFYDWFALLNHGYRVVGVGASDSHDVSRFIVGQGRTYIQCDDKDPGKLNVNEAVDNLRKGKALISLGLITTLKVDNKFGVGDLAIGLGDDVHVAIQVLGPSWITADKVQLFANGGLIREQVLAPTTNVQKANLEWTIPKPAEDIHLIAIASGPGVRSPHWAIPRPYQPSSTRWNSRVFGATNPIWLDADGDGKFTPSRKPITRPD